MKMIKLAHTPFFTNRNLIISLAISLILLVAGHDAQAQVTLNLTPAAGSGNAGSTIIYSGTISNLSGSAITLNSASFGSLSPATSQITENDDGLFFGTLAANSSYSGDIFSVTLAQTIATSTYQGSVGILYNNGASVSNFQNFIINATGGGGTMPEPEAVVLLATGLSAMIGAVTLRRRFIAS